MREDWEIEELGKLFHTTSGGTPSRKNKEFYEGEIPWVKSGELDKGIIYDTEEKISEEAVKNSSAKLFPEGTLLIALYGATIEKLAFLGVRATTNQAICGIFKNEFVDSDYLYNFLRFRRPKLISQGTGGAQPNISQTILKRLKLPFPSKPEQRAIVHKIENLFGSLDKGIADLKKAQEQLKVYRQAVLKKAFEGELTKEWREKHVKTDGRPSQEKATTAIAAEPKVNYENQSENKLPEGWGLVKLEDVGSWKGGGTPSKRKKEFWENGNVLWVSPKDMKTAVISETINKITKKSIENSSAKWIKKGAILIVVRSGIIRRTLPVAIAGENLTVNQDLQSIHPNNDFISDFIYWFLMAFERDIRQNCAKDGTTVDNINVPVLKKYIISKPSLKEQRQIVREIESRLSVCDKVEQNITEGLEKSEALRQSILKKAFEGKLLSEAEIEKCKQAADYEPASVLLEKIKKEKK